MGQRLRLPTEKEAETEHQANVATILAGPRHSNSEIRKSYMMHRKSIFVLDPIDKSLSFRARSNWTFRRHLEELSRAKMNDLDRQVAEERNQCEFGGTPSPSFEYLIQDAKERGLDKKGQLEAVIHWAVRPDLYYVVPHPNAFGPTAPDIRRRNPPKPNKEEKDQIFRVRPLWSPTGDPVKPWAAVVARKRWEIRINDFPEEQLFTLLVDGAEKLSFDSWPKGWKRPR